MSLYTRLLIPFLLLVLLGVEKIVAEELCSDEELYVIRSTGSNNVLVLDGNEPARIRVQYFTGDSSQLWQFRRGSKAGLHYIINNHTGQALDFVENDLINLVSKKKKNILNQQWNLNLNGRITNAANRRNIDVYWAKYISGNGLILHEDNGSHAQWFDIQLVGTKPKPNLGEPETYLNEI